MSKTLATVLCVLLVLVLFAGGGVWWVRALSAGVFSLALLFWFYLVFTLPLPGTGGTVPRELVLLTLYLGWLGAAAVASWRGERRATSTTSVGPLELAEVRG